MQYLAGIFLLTVLGAFAGCGGQTGLDGTARVTGTVTHNQQPVEGATVTFSPVGEGRAASGRTDADGKFELTTLTANDGVMPGTYQVAVSKTDAQGEMTAEESQAYLEAHGQAPPPRVVKDLLPVRYKRPDSSNLTAEVIAGGENDFTFNLDD